MLFSRWGSLHRQPDVTATACNSRQSSSLSQDLGNGSHGPGTSGRLELKYLLSLEDARRISRFLSSQLEVDRHAQGRLNNAYTVRSVYFDSPGLICYHAKENGGPIRQKYRVRTYDEPGAAARFLERKARQGNLYRKEKVRVDDAWLACLGGRDGLSCIEGCPSLLQRLLFLMDRHAFVPTALIAYEREAYVEFADQDTVRITIDRNLRAAAFPRLEGIHDEEDLRPILTHGAILEVKFTDVVPQALRQLTRRFPLLRRACSKYAACIENLVVNSPSPKEVWSHVRLF
ncbi:MAG: polyphosphate polymerase domain-containing protein [Candidatus Bipolaricaulota bacterium]